MINAKFVQPFVVTAVPFVGTNPKLVTKKTMLGFIEEAIHVCDRITRTKHDHVLGVLPNGPLTEEDLERHSEGVERLEIVFEMVQASARNVDVEVAAVCTCEKVLARLSDIRVRTLSDLYHFDRTICRAILTQVEQAGGKRQYQMLALAS